MLESMYIAATGMHAEQAQIDTVANNLVNMNTNGFKKSRVAFSTLMPQSTASAATDGVASSDATSGVAHATWRGAGVSGNEALLDFSAGSLKQTQGELDLAIQGRGLFEVQLPDGSFAYSRDGALHVNNDGYLATAEGYPLSAMIQVPTDMEKVVIGLDGRVQIKTQNSDQLSDAGYLQISRFTNDAGLESIGNNLYIRTDSSGEPAYSRAGENGAGTISQGYLEASNVQLIEELTNMMSAQRAYEANSKVLQAADEVLGIINTLRK